MKLLLLSLLLFFYIESYSQYDFKPGYIIKLNGSTEEGYINLQGNEFNAKKCEYKKDLTSNPVIYLPSEITAYRLTDSKYFVSKSAPIENSDTTLFLECLISGKSSIYYTKWNSKNYYFIEVDGKIQEINNNEIVVVRNGTDYISRSNQYKRVLANSFKDCPPVLEELKTTDFSKKSLIKLSKKYHDYVCSDEQCIIYEKQNTKKKMQWGLDFSYGPSNFEINDVNVIVKMDQSMIYQIGLNSQMNIDEEGAFNLLVALRYYSYKNQISNVIGYSQGNDPSDINYEYSILKPEVQLKYKMKLNKINPFVSAGFFSNIFLKDEGSIYSANYKYTTRFTSGGLDESSKGSINGMVGFSGEVGFETGLRPGTISFSLFYEQFLTNPFQPSNNMGIRCGYSLPF